MAHIYIVFLEKEWPVSCLRRCLPMKLAPSFALYACLGLAAGCGHPDTTRGEQPGAVQKLPFGGLPQSGVSPSQSIVPSAMHIPEGTTISVSLEHTLSSASAHPTDAFTATLTEAIVVEGETIAPAGAPAAGLVLETRHATSSREPGYLRVALTTLTINGKPLSIATSTLFAKGGLREEHASAGDKTSGSKEMVFIPGRRLSFRLTQNLDLP